MYSEIAEEIHFCRLSTFMSLIKVSEQCASTSQQFMCGLRITVHMKVSNNVDKCEEMAKHLYAVISSTEHG